MAVTKTDVEHIAELAHLKFDESELDSLTGQLNQILTYVEKLNELDTETVEPLSYPVDGVNVFRNDNLIDSVPTEVALKNAPSSDELFFRVPKVINREP